MAKELSLEEKLQEIDSVMNTMDLKPEVFIFKNPVLNGMFFGNDDTGGFPIGSVAQIAAESGAGKSTICLNICRELAEQGKKILYIDAEKGLNLNQLKTTRVIDYVENKSIMIQRENNIGALNTLIQKLADINYFDFMIIDSLGALDSGLYSIHGQNIDANNPKVGSNTQSLKALIKTINGLAIPRENKKRLSFILVNHVASQIGAYIPTTNPTGGAAPKYLSDITIKLTVKSSDYAKARLGQKVEYEATKSRFGPGKCKIPFYIRYGRGIALVPTMAEVLDKVEVKYNGETRPLMETKGSGFITIYLNNQEYKLRGQSQLYSFLQDHYYEILPLISFKLFAPPEPEEASKYDDPIYLEDYSALPADLKSIKVKKVDGPKQYLEYGVDESGQEYSVWYDTTFDTLNYNYDTTKGNTELEPTKKTYNKIMKELKEYMKSLDEE